MSRMKAHWPERINPMMELRSAIRWLEADLGRCDLYRCLAICEAISIIEWCLNALRRDNEILSAKLREEYRNRPDFSINPFDP